MSLKFQRGKAAIEDAAKGSGKKFTPFVPQISWKDGEEKYILFLTDIDQTYRLLLHEWVDCGKKKMGEKEMTDWGFFLSRKDPAIGEATDPLEQKGSSPRTRILAAAVELEPLLAEGGTGRSRPKGFTVKTTEYTRKTDDGDEEVTAPAIGIITQASKNFFKLLMSHDQSEGPIQETAFKVRRVGGDSETAYAFTPYFDQEIDLTDLIAYIDGISYLSDDEDTWEAIEDVLANENGTEDADERVTAMAIADIMLAKRVAELADWDTYQEKTDAIEKIESPYGDDKKKTERAPRRSQRDKDGSGEKSEKSEAAPRAAKSDRFAEIKALAEAKKKEKASA